MRPHANAVPGYPQMKSPAGLQCIISIKVVLSNSKINKLVQESHSAFRGVFWVP